MEKLKINMEGAVSLCNATTGRPRKEIEAEIRAAFWPDTLKESDRKQNYNRLIKKPSMWWPHWILMLKNITQVPWGYLFEG